MSSDIENFLGQQPALMRRSVTEDPSIAAWILASKAEDSKSDQDSTLSMQSTSKGSPRSPHGLTTIIDDTISESTLLESRCVSKEARCASKHEPELLCQGLLCPSPTARSKVTPIEIKNHLTIGGLDECVKDLWTVESPAPERQKPDDKPEAAIARVAQLAADIRDQIEFSKHSHRAKSKPRCHSWDNGDYASPLMTSNSAKQVGAEKEVTGSIPYCERKPLCVLPRHEPEFVAPAKHDKKGVIVFDWDDTLFPSWHLAEVIHPTLDKDRRYAKLDDDSEFFEPMKAHAMLIRSLLQTVGSVAHVHIVTLGLRPWVEDSSEWFLPGFDLPALLDEYGIRIYYAREHITRRDQRAAVYEEGVDMYTTAKRNAMKKCLHDVCKKDPDISMSTANVVAVGDSLAEIQGLQELMWCYDEDTSFCKTMKMLPEPSLHVLAMQLEVMQSWLVPLLAYEEDVDIDFGMKMTHPVIKRLLANHNDYARSTHKDTHSDGTHSMFASQTEGRTGHGSSP